MILYAVSSTCFLLLFSVAPINCKDEPLLSTSAVNSYNGEEVASEDVSAVSKRQTNFQNNFDQQQIPREDFDFIQQTDSAGDSVPQQPQFGQRNQEQPPVFPSGLPSGVPPPRTTTRSPFTSEQIRFQQEYARRGFLEQQTALIRPRQRPITRPTPSPFQAQPSPAAGPQQRPLQFLDQNGQVRQQTFASQQQNFASPEQEQENFARAQQDFVPAAQNVLTVQGDEPFSYAQVQFGPAPNQQQQAEPVVSRPKGQRSVPRLRVNSNIAVEPITQQTIDYPVTQQSVEYPFEQQSTVGPDYVPTTINPAKLSARLLQNVVYIQPNGQTYKPIEDTEPVVQIPRKNNYYYLQSAPIVSVPVTSSSPAISSEASSTAAAVTTTDDAIKEEVVFIPQPQKRPAPTRARQEARKSGRVTQQQQQQQQQYQAQRTERPEHHAPQYSSEQQSSEVEPDNFLTSLLSRFQEQQPQDTVAAAPFKPRSGSLQRPSNGGSRSEASKYLPEKNQLQLLQFPHELKSLSSSELRVLEEANKHMSTATDKPAGQKKQSLRNRANGKSTTPPPIPSLPPTAELVSNHRPVPTPVELSEEQRQFLASQGIRHLYRVDYDQAGNVLPLTYVLALDNRPGRAEQQ